jgi:hypothetical protein
MAAAAPPASGRVFQFKLVLLGDSAVGKSSLVLRFVRGQFFEYQESTIGAAFLTQTVALNDTTVKFEIWDTAGQERYHSLAPMYYRGAAAAIVVYDITNRVRERAPAARALASAPPRRPPGRTPLQPFPREGRLCTRLLRASAAPRALRAPCARVCRAAAVLPCARRGLRSVRCRAGHVPAREAVGEGAAEAGQPKHRDCACGQQV